MAAEGAKTVAQWLEKGESFLEQRGVTEAAANCEFILAEVLGCNRPQVLASGGRSLSWKQENHFWDLVKRRGRRVPLAYLLGTQPFAGLEIKVKPQVLIPRPETEQLVECVIKTARLRFADRIQAGAPLHVVEIGTGSGCIAVALAKALSGAIIYATEISDTALRLAEDNARAHGVDGRIRFLREDLFKPSKGPTPWADILVSNPPYVPSGELEHLEPEVLEEPVLALDGGKDGLDAIRAIASDAPRVLKRGGRLAIEFGDGQAEDVSAVLEGAGFADIEIHKDLQDHHRFAIALLEKP
ncbi:peptide chain release factor N(5)-glutamine methyltransferase [Elusimicrobiota bacterium]